MYEQKQNRLVSYNEDFSLWQIQTLSSTILRGETNLNAYNVIIRAPPYIIWHFVDANKEEERRKEEGIAHVFFFKKNIKYNYIFFVLSCL